MAKQIINVKIIYSCLECKEYDTWCENYQIFGKCCLTGKKVDNENIIPNWCPLPEYEDGDNNG